MMQIKAIGSTLFSSLIVLGCVMTTAVSFKQVLNEPGANFHLYVSNQSFDEPSIDIIATIDGKVVVADRLKVKNQHHWEVYSICLPKGQHVLHAEAKKGTVLLDVSFDVTEKHWAVLSYWGRRDKNDPSKLHGLNFEVLDKQPIFI